MALTQKPRTPAPTTLSTIRTRRSAKVIITAPPVLIPPAVALAARRPEDSPIPPTRLARPTTCALVTATELTRSTGTLVRPRQYLVRLPRSAPLPIHAPVRDDEYQVSLIYLRRPKTARFIVAYYFYT